MANNIEIKARVLKFAVLAKAAEAIAGEKPVLIYQHDTFFHSPTGRLKLREFSDGSAELISYLRADTLEPVASDYLIYKTNEPDLLRDTLQKTLGIRGVVKKKRCLFMVGRTRIHLDEVEDLGHFLELEVVLAPGEDPLSGEQEALHLMQNLGVLKQDLIECAYIDLICALET